MSGSSLAKKSAPHGERAVTKPVKLPGFLETYRASPFERVAAIRKGVPAAAVAETSKAMGMPQERLYQILRLPRTTVTRKIAENGVLSREGSERVIGLRKIIGQVEQMVGESGDPEGFNAAEWVSRWLESPSSALGGQKPGELMDTTEGQELVSRLIARMQSGSGAACFPECIRATRRLSLKLSGAFPLECAASRLIEVQPCPSSRSSSLAPAPPA